MLTAKKATELTGPMGCEATRHRKVSATRCAGEYRRASIVCCVSFRLRSRQSGSRCYSREVRAPLLWRTAFARSKLGYDRSLTSLVKTAVDDRGFVGIKVHRHDARITREVCDRLGTHAHRVPVLFDPVGEVSIAELLATEYPDVNFIIAHLGSFSDDWRAQQAFIDPLSRYPNLYTIMRSGIEYFNLLSKKIRRLTGPWRRNIVPFRQGRGCIRS